MEKNKSLLADLSGVTTPSFVLDTIALKKNLIKFESIRNRTGCRILLALKAFAMFSVFPLFRNHLDGVCASSQDEARLGREELNKEVHSYAVAFSDREFKSIIGFSDHVVFNSFSQWKRFRPLIIKTPHTISCGIRVNPEHSEGIFSRYDPCGKNSRLGVRIQHFEAKEMDNISGLHFHTLCEQNADALQRTFAAFEKSFGPYLYERSWLNIGGGHHISSRDYDIDLLCKLIDNIKKKYQVDIYLEPGQAIALNAGFFITSVIDIIACDMPTAILDTSAATHMPDVCEMSFKPHIIDSDDSGLKRFSYRLAGMSCLAGDIIGEYSFDNPLRVGDKLLFSDMAHYTMVKTNTFNGIRLPSIYLYDAEKRGIELVKKFGYENYKSRLS